MQRTRPSRYLTDDSHDGHEVMTDVTVHLPRLRTDLVLSQHHSAGESSLVMKDPVSGAFFRLREAEQFIAGQFDGQTSLDVVRQRTEQRFGAPLDAEVLTAFVQKLAGSHLLEPVGESRQATSLQAGRLAGSLLYLRLRLLDPTRFFDRLMPRIAFLYRPRVLVLSAATILLAAGVTVANWSQYAADLARLYRPETIPLLLAVTFLVVSAHECAHGLTCRRFGGEVREIGFMFIYFQPALYCNVSDAWLFPEKSKRLWVGVAGPFLELFLWALATLAWWLTDPATWINYVALVAMTASGVKTLLNFNPLLKLDGYYLLSDYLEIPNLRQKAFRYLGEQLERAVGLAHEAGMVPSARERKIFLAYGLTGTVGSLAVLAYVVVAAGGFLIEIREPALLTLLLGLVSLRFRRRLRALFGKTNTPDGEEDAMDTTPSSAPPTLPPDDKNKKKTRRRGRRGAKRWVRWAVVAAAATVVLLFGRMELRVAGAFGVLPEGNADVRAAVDGIIAAILVDEGRQVRAGDVIAQLAGGVLVSERSQTDAEIKEHQSVLQRLIAGPTLAEVDLARAAVATVADELKVGLVRVSRAEDQLGYQEQRLSRAKQMFDQGLTSRVQFDDAEQLLVAATKEVAEARGRLEVLKKQLAEAEGRAALLAKGTRPEVIAAERAQLERLDVQRRFQQEQLQHLNVFSPVDGVVATPSRQLAQMKGQMVRKGDLIVKIFELERVAVQILIAEKEIADIQIGQTVALRARAYPNRTFAGTVTFMATSAQESSAAGAGGPAAPAGAPSVESSSGRMIAITTLIDNSAHLLKPGMTGLAKVSAGKRSLGELMLRRVWRTFKVDVWSWW